MASRTARSFANRVFALKGLASRWMPRALVHWSALLRRVFQLDVLCCPCCEGRMVMLAAINDADVAPLRFPP